MLPQTSLRSLTLKSISGKQSAKSLSYTTINSHDPYTWSLQSLVNTKDFIVKKLREENESSISCTLPNALLQVHQRQLCKDLALHGFKVVIIKNNSKTPTYNMTVTLKTK